MTKPKRKRKDVIKEARILAAQVVERLAMTNLLSPDPDMPKMIDEWTRIARKLRAGKV